MLAILVLFAPATGSGVVSSVSSLRRLLHTSSTGACAPDKLLHLPTSGIATGSTRPNIVPATLLFNGKRDLLNDSVPTTDSLKTNVLHTLSLHHGFNSEFATGSGNDNILPCLLVPRRQPLLRPLR